MKSSKPSVPYPWRASLIFLCIASADACETAGSGATSSTSWDSAGITIVEAGAPAWESGSEVTVSASPLLRISTLEGSERPTLYGITDAVDRKDGMIVAAERHRLFLISQSGELVLNTGSAGDGPGEFRNIRSIVLLRNDSVAVFDAGNQRITVYDRGLSRVREERISQRLVRDVLGIQGDTIVIVIDHSPDAELPLNGAFRTPLTVGQWRGEEPLHDIWRGSGAEIQVMNYRGGRVQIRPLFSQGASFALNDDALYVTQDSVVGFSVVRDGTVKVKVRVEGVDLSVSSEEVADERAALLGPNPPLARVALMSRLENPRRRPPSAAISVDPTGLVWIEQFRGWSERHEPVKWWIFSVSGEWLGEIAGPEQFTPLHIGGENIIGVFRDENDVEYLQVVPLERR